MVVGIFPVSNMANIGEIPERFMEIYSWFYVNDE